MGALIEKRKVKMLATASYIYCFNSNHFGMYHIQRIMRVIKKEWTFVLNSSEFVQLSVFKFVEKTSVFFDPNEFSGP